MLPDEFPDELYGEFDWFAVDRDGHIGHFSSAGYGAIPLVVTEHVREYIELQDHFSEMKGTYNAVLVRRDGNRQHWLNIAQQGVYSFDFKHWDGPYVLVAKPSAPVVIQNFPPEMRLVIERVRFEGVCFQEIEAIAPQEYVKCWRWK